MPLIELECINNDQFGIFNFSDEELIPILLYLASSVFYRKLQEQLIRILNNMKIDLFIMKIEKKHIKIIILKFYKMENGK